MSKRTILCIFALSATFGWGTKIAYPIGAVEDGLIAYWSFDKDTVDVKKHAIDVWADLVAVVRGDPELAPSSDCKVGECLLFDGDVDSLLVEDTNPPTINRDWKEITIECWAYINALDDSWNRIVTLDNTEAGDSSVATLYYDDDDNRHNFWVRAGGKDTDAGQDDIQRDIPLEEWLHLVGTYDGDMVHYYINGELAKSHKHSGGILKKGSLLLAIGDRTDACNCDAIQGYIDEVRIYERALSAAEVANNFSAEGLAVNPSGKLSATWGDIKSRN